MKVLVVSVHPDDETLGCGGTLLKHTQKGDDVYWLIVTCATREAGFSEGFIRERDEQIRKICDVYQFRKTFNLELPATQLHRQDIGEVIKKISSIFQEVTPEVVYTVNRSDVHTDHQIVAQAIMSSAKSFRAPYIKRILMYECLSETEMAFPLPENCFLPNVYSDISEFLDKKIEIMGIYESEIQSPPLPRSLENIKALARFRGASVAVHYAEAFMLLREKF